MDSTTDRLYVAHPTNDCVEVVDLRTRAFQRSLPGLRGVAGVWVDEARSLLFTSNRQEDTVSVFRIEAGGETELWRASTGVRPNGIAFDTERERLLVAGVGDATRAGAPPTLTLFDLRRRTAISRIDVPGRTRWATYHRATDAFYVNVADPASIVRVAGADPTRIDRVHSIPERGPHGLEQHPGGELLFCACDSGRLLVLDASTGSIREAGTLAGTPDVLWLDSRRERLYVATDEAPSVEVFGFDPLRHIETFPTSSGAHTLTVDPTRHEVHVFLPSTHEDLVLSDSDSP